MQLLEEDFKRDFYLDAQEAVKYGLIDQTTMPKRPTKAGKDLQLGSGGDGAEQPPQLQRV